MTFGENYGGGKIGEGASSAPGMEPPVHDWVSSTAPRQGSDDLIYLLTDSSNGQLLRLLPP